MEICSESPGSWSSYWAHQWMWAFCLAVKSLTHFWFEASEVTDVWGTPGTQYFPWLVGARVAVERVLGPDIPHFEFLKFTFQIQTYSFGPWLMRQLMRLMRLVQGNCFGRVHTRLSFPIGTHLCLFAQGHNKTLPRLQMWVLETDNS